MIEQYLNDTQQMPDQYLTANILLMYNWCLLDQVKSCEKISDVLAMCQDAGTW